MHTVMVVVLGLGLLGLCALAGRVFGGPSGTATAALIFLPIYMRRISVAQTFAEAIMQELQAPR